MFKALFLFFAMVAAVLAAPAANPSPSPVAAPSPVAPAVVTYGAPAVAYTSGYHVPVAYGAYHHVAAVPATYTYGTQVVY